MGQNRLNCAGHLQCIKCENLGNIAISVFQVDNSLWDIMDVHHCSFEEAIDR